MKASSASTSARRFLSALTLISSKIPAVELPHRRLSLKSRLAWTLTILTLYFFLSNIPLFGLSPLAMELFSRWRAIFAGKIFSLTALGITPILSASILTQILAGRKVLKLDLSEPEEQALYLNIQKFLVVIFAALVSLTYVVVFYQPDPALSSEFGTLTVLLLLFSEVFAGGMLIYFMDSVVSRWGIGSGVGLFILADVSQAMFAGLVNPEMEVGYGGNLWAIGVIPRLIQIIFMPESIGLTGGVYEKLTIDFLFASGIIALIATIAVFFAIIYVESMRLSVKVPGFRRRKRLLVPVKFVYFTYIFFIPLMFALDILHIIQAIGKMLYARGITILGTYDRWGNAESGIMYFLQPIYSPYDWIPALMATPHEPWEIALRILISTSMLIVATILSAFLWIKLTEGLEEKDIMRMVRSLSLPIRKDFQIKAIKRQIDRQTSRILVLECVIFCILSEILNMFGSLGNVSVYLLLAVSIAYGFYEEWMFWAFSER